jgi:hypothetical protein
MILNYIGNRLYQIIKYTTIGNYHLDPSIEEWQVTKKNNSSSSQNKH